MIIYAFKYDYANGTTTLVGALNYNDAVDCFLAAQRAKGWYDAIDDTNYDEPNATTYLDMGEAQVIVREFENTLGLIGEF
jgi:hypothetical protein